MKIVLGVGGGIAAYKSALLLRLLTEAGHDVRVIPTRASLNFVGAATWEALSHHPVSTEVFDHVDEVQHVRLGQEADLVVVAPATADLLARVANGRADDLLTSTILATRAPVVLAPAMHTEMWENPATVANVALLRDRGITVVEPAVGRLTGKDTGAGRLPDPEVIRDAALAAATQSASRHAESPGVEVEGTSPWSGRKVIVTLGGTREPLDPVRYLGNRSSGKQGLACAKALAACGADVTIIAGSVEVDLPRMLSGRPVSVVRIETALQLQAALEERLPAQDALIMAAAVADFRPRVVVDHKIKKRDDREDPVIELVRNPDIIAGLGAARQVGDTPKLVAFAAETGDAQGSVMEYAQGKLERKRVDALCVNRVSATEGFGRDDNTLTVLYADGRTPVEARGSKDRVAEIVIRDLGAALFPQP
jgi:phosphopantothenoylcysteine decarboxylase/phosphopantothenate--cysteine ligase